MPVHQEEIKGQPLGDRRSRRGTRDAEIGASLGVQAGAAAGAGSTASFSGTYRTHALSQHAEFGTDAGVQSLLELSSAALYHLCFRFVTGTQRQ